MTDNKTVNEYIFRINRTFDYIENNIDKPITLEELASVANFSKFHFSRIFQSIIGETPFQFIVRVRLEKAWNWVYGHWMPTNGYQPDDKPCFEMYPEEPKNGKFTVDICIPVKPM